MHQTNSGKSPKFAFSPTFIFCSPICPNNCGVVFWSKYILVFENWFFSFDRLNMQIFIVNIAWVVWPRVTNLLDLWYSCQHNPLFYHLNLPLWHSYLNYLWFFKTSKLFRLLDYAWVLLSKILLSVTVTWLTFQPRIFIVTVIFLIMPKARRSSYTMAFRIKVVAEAKAVENSSEVTWDYGTRPGDYSFWQA